MARHPINPRCTEEKMEFLRQEEERLAGKVVKISIHGHLWRGKLVCASEHFQRYIAYLNATGSYRFGNQFYEHLSKVRRRPVSSYEMDCLFPWPAGVCKERFKEIFTAYFHIKVLRLFLDSNYKPPSDCIDLLNHFYVYNYYLQNMFVFRFFYPIVNEFINFAAVKLIRGSTMTMENILQVETRKDHAMPGALKMRSLSDQKKQAIKNILAKYNIKGLQVFRSDKVLREKFMAECRSRTRDIDKKNSLPLSDDRILKIAREIAKER